MCNLLYCDSLQATEIQITMPKFGLRALSHRNPSTFLNPPCGELPHPIHNAVFMISETSIEYGPRGRWKQSGTASELSLGPYPLSKSGQYCSGSVEASRLSCCRYSWNPEKACLNPREETDETLGVGQKSTSQRLITPAS